MFCVINPVLSSAALHNQTRKLSWRCRRAVSFAVSQMGTDQRDERWWVEETCLIKTKRWNDSLMPVLDALCMLHSYYTWFFFFFWRGSCSGLDGGRCCRHKEGEEEGVSLMKFLIIPPPLAQWRITECHLGQCSLWNYIYEIHPSLFFFYSFCLFLLVPLPPLPPLPLIGDAIKVCGVSGSSRWSSL